MMRRTATGIATGLMLFLVMTIPREAAAGAMPVALTVRLPGDAVLELAGVRMSGTGAVRRFRTPPIDTDREFPYRVRATWSEEGQTRVLQRLLRIRGGQSIDVDLSRDDDITSQERGLIALVNRERAKVRAAPLISSPELMRAARSHAANMATKRGMAHTLEGETFWQRIAKTGYRSSAAGENIASGAATPAAAMRIWMRSTAGHRENILDRRFKAIGVGVATASDGRKYWTQVFATPVQSPGGSGAEPQ